LDDGSIVHINKTTISDTDEDGNSFFFHKSVIHTVSDGQTSNEEEDVEEEALTGDPESIEEGDDNLKEEEEKSGGVETAGVDDGLMQ